MSQGLEFIHSGQGEDDHGSKENLITLYFSQLVGYYFGQDAFAIRQEAFDDMLWVVLGWLDTKQFVDLHTTLHYDSASSEPGAAVSQGILTCVRNQTWHGNIWTPAFAHRARIFWELAAKGWDEKLCGGGMNWNPRFEPYKNAITNELFISASIAMYLHFPGDANTSPYVSIIPSVVGPDDVNAVGWNAHDPRFLDTAVRGYTWLRGSGMRNDQGLYVDGFHVSGYNNQSDNNTRCDMRNEMVYTYNQGVVLSGLLGLFRATCNSSYLQDGHRLIQDVIGATGYDLRHDRPIDDPSQTPPGRLPPWRGIGRAGVLEEACDVPGDCTQDAHTFKGIYFHHLAAFCAPLEVVTDPTLSVGRQQLLELRKGHARACRAYRGWIKHNSIAALLTRDAVGKFGMWWTAGLLNITLETLDLCQAGIGPDYAHAVDYRNYGVPNAPIWTPDVTGVTPGRGAFNDGTGQRPLGERKKRVASSVSDPNNRGRGRTVETQSGGLAVLRALWEISRQHP
jgi:hypothetical protein